MERWRSLLSQRKRFLLAGKEPQSLVELDDLAFQLLRDNIKSLEYTADDDSYVPLSTEVVDWIYEAIESGRLRVHMNRLPATEWRERVGNLDILSFGMLYVGIVDVPPSLVRQIRDLLSYRG
jgi:hypothetical protein